MELSVKDLMLPLSEYAVVDEDATILDALRVLKEKQEQLAPERQPHRAVLVRDRKGAIVGKLHHFAFLRAFHPEHEFMIDRKVLDRAGVGEDLIASTMQALDFFTGDLVDLCERARTVIVRDVFSTSTKGISVHAGLTDAIKIFLTQQTLSLLVHSGDETVGILRLSDLFDELSRRVISDECA